MQLELIILSTKQNYQWTSMQEILPGLEEVWDIIGKRENLVITTIDVDTAEPREFLKSYLNAKYIVSIAFNTKIAKFLHYIRIKVGCDAKILFHLHGLATIGCWPLHRFGVLNILKTNDIFLGTCNGDHKSLLKTFKSFQYIQHMFPLKIKNSSHSPRDITPFVFIGRISIQKNLHTLLKCYLQAHSQNPQLSPLYLYGSQDHLGYPNLGIKNSTYLNDLIKLVPSNVLNHKIFFKGFVEREVIQKEIGSQHIFISTSLHSDENFGMAALRSLYIGAKAILTDWGGHQNFIKYYPQSIQYIDVKFNNGVLAIDEEQLIQSFTNTSLLPHLIQTKENGRFEAMNIATQIQDKITEFNHIAAEEISPTILAEKLYEQQALFEKNGELQRCFRDFADPIYHEYISQYL